MPRDKRMWMTFPIDFHRHPKMRRLPIEVRWTFVEMNGEARIADNDGVFGEDDAEFMWPVEHLDALVKSHPTRPLVVHADGCYVIRDYAEHQETRAVREERVQRNRENGQKGGRPPKNPPETQSVTGGLPTEPSRNRQEPNPKQSQSQSQRTTHLNESSHLYESVAGPVENTAIAVLTGMGISHERLTAHIRQHTNHTLTTVGAMRVAMHLLEKANGDVKKPQSYVLSAITKSPFEVQQFVDEEGID